jgi:hypothetical protein
VEILLHAIHHQPHPPLPPTNRPTAQYLLTTTIRVYLWWSWELLALSLLPLCFRISTSLSVLVLRRLEPITLTFPVGMASTLEKSANIHTKKHLGCSRTPVLAAQPSITNDRRKRTSVCDDIDTTPSRRLCASAYSSTGTITTRLRAPACATTHPF